MVTRPATSDPGWVTLTEACRLLGVSPSTVRRWGDTGMVRTFVTPGGHRRFSRSGLEALLPEKPAARPSLADLGETPSRMARGYRRAADEDHSSIPWVAELDEAQRERFRGTGRSIVTALVDALSADEPSLRAERIREAEAVCAEYGRMSGLQGLGASTAADLFLRYRRPFLAELGAVARRRDFDASASTTLLADANEVLDGLLLATLRGWETTTVLGPAVRPSRSRRPIASTTGSPS